MHECGPAARRSCPRTSADGKTTFEEWMKKPKPIWTKKAAAALAAAAAAPGPSSMVVDDEDEDENDDDDDSDEAD